MKIKRVKTEWQRRQKYRKSPIISPGVKFVRRVFLRGLFSGELIIKVGFARQKWFDLY